MGGHPRRLDSWKQIADYLDRDVRTAMRWAKSHGLPARRVAGGKGRSVFAFSEEIDAWLAGHPLETAPPADVPAAADPAPEPAPPPPSPHQEPAAARGPAYRTAAVAMVLGVLTLAGVALTSRQPASRLDLETLQARVDGTGITVTDGRGASRLLHAFDPSVVTKIVPSTPPSTLVADLEGDGTPEVLAATAYAQSPSDRIMTGGEMLALSPSGDSRWRFRFDDVLAFPKERFGEPWVMTDWQVSRGQAPRRTAVAAHHYMWWPSMAAVLDRDGRRLGTFVNPGWIEHVLWLDADRIAVSGFNNEQNAGMVAVLDARQPDGHAPTRDGSEYRCAACPASAPLFYATLPRSELNIATGSRFNRAYATLLDDEVLVVTTLEVGEDAISGTAIYEFTRDLQLRRAMYSERYWDIHRQLELQGTIKHGQAECPERLGPRAIQVWRGDGWRSVVPPGQD